MFDSACRRSNVNACTKQNGQQFIRGRTARRKARAKELLKKGYSYRQIMRILRLKSTASVAYYLKGRQTAKMEITCTTENPAKEYRYRVDRAENVQSLYQAILPFADFAADALEIAWKMSEADFKRWKRGRIQERKGIFAGEQFSTRFGALLLPAKMLVASLVELEYEVPWGTAYLLNEQEGWPM